MKKLIIATVFTAAFMAVPAYAQVYLGAGVGQAHTDSNETSWKLYAGYQFTPVWGLELAYTDLGRYTGANIESQSLAVTGTLPLADRWSLLGKLGGTSNRSHFSGASNNSEVLAGVGVGYSIDKNTAVRLEYEDFGKLAKASSGNNSRGSNLGLSIKYGF